MGEMADYFIDQGFEQMLSGAWGSSGYCGPTYEDYIFRETPEGEWLDGDGLLVAIADMSDDRIGAAIGWCLKHFPDESKEKVAELKAEQVRREFECL